MKKSTIWILIVTMALTFGTLLYFQLMYLEKIVGMRNEQFSESVMRSLYSTASYLERLETQHYLEQDISSMESALYGYGETPGVGGVQYQFEGPDGMVTNFTVTRGIDLSHRDREPKLDMPSPTQNVGSRYQTLQEAIRGQYLYQKGLLNEVILTIMRDSGTRAPIERADSTEIRNYLATELANNGLNVPFAFAVTNDKRDIVYCSEGYVRNSGEEVYSQVLFPNSTVRYRLNVVFPTKEDYIFSSVRFIIPSLTFTLILMVVFIYTIVLAFRQKRITEMKTDFINNMTHELKTPVSTISLAAQMLSDDSVTKSPAMLKHLYGVINDESKRMRFQVEKVLQMSVLDRNTEAALKFQAVDANSVIESIANTFKIKAEKYGGSITCHLNARNAEVHVDPMHFTNVIFNLLDNAVKYKREDVPPVLEITTTDRGADLEIRVKDNGLGIRKEDQRRIFDRFYRVSTGNRHDVKGFGLGLAYVKKMVTLFMGSISVESVVGKGTTFIILLPLVNQNPSNKINK